MCHIVLFSLGVLISGGDGVETESKVELFDINEKVSCTLPDLPENNGRSRHTSNGGVLCGGQATGSKDSATTCLDISSGSWSSSNYETLNAKFSDHISWNLGLRESFMLLGGGQQLKTTNIVHPDGFVDTGFTMKYRVT